MEYQFDDLVQRVANKLGEGWTAYASLSSAQQTRVKSIINSGYNLFIRPPVLPGERKHYEWYFLRPIHTLTAWATVESTLDGPNTTLDKTGNLSGAHSTTTVTVKAALFTSWMVGETLKVTYLGFPFEYTIVSVTSSTVCVVDSAVTGADDDSVVVQVTAVTADDAMFYENMVDSGETVTIGSTGYTLLDVTSTTVCHVSGNASGAADEATCSVTADGDYRLPADYGAIAGPLTHATSSGYWPVKIVGESALRHVRRYNAGSGTPTIAAIRPLAIVQTTLQEFDLLLHPIPNVAYELTYRYHVRLSEITDTNKRLPGAADHSEIILQACLAAAEQRMFDRRGDEYGNFMTMLPAAISFDRNAHSAEEFGTPGSRAAYGILHATDEFVTVGGTLR